MPSFALPPFIAPVVAFISPSPFYLSFEYYQIIVSFTNELSLAVMQFTCTACSRFLNTEEDGQNNIQVHLKIVVICGASHRESHARGARNFLASPLLSLPINSFLFLLSYLDHHHKPPSASSQTVSALVLPSEPRHITNSC
jgi:hypothetical protein